MLALRLVNVAPIVYDPVVVLNKETGGDVFHPVLRLVLNVRSGIDNDVGIALAAFEFLIDGVIDFETLVLVLTDVVEMDNGLGCWGHLRIRLELRIDKEGLVRVVEAKTLVVDTVVGLQELHHFR